MRRLSIVSAFAVVTASVTAAFEEKQPAFRAAVTEVAVDVQAHDEHTGQPFGALSATDFEIREDGLPRQVVACLYDATGIDLVIVVQLNRPASRDRYVENTLRQLRAVVDEMHPKDRIAVVSFQSRAKVLVPFSTDTLTTAAALAKTINATSFHQQTWRIHDAIVAAAGLFTGKAHPSRRRAVLLAFDRKEAHSRTTLSQVVTAMLERDASLYAARVRSGPRGKFRFGVALPGAKLENPDPEIPEAPSVEEVVNATGGDLLTGPDAVRLLSDSLECLKRRYRLYFNARPGSVKELRRINVSLTAQARSRYPHIVLRSQATYLFHPE